MDKRSAQRWNLDPFEVAVVSINSRDFVVKDISYDSLSVNPGEFSKRFSHSNSNYFGGILNICGREIAVELQMTRSTSTLVAFRFVHKTPEVLVFLRDFLDCLRCGDTLKKIPNENLSDQFQEKDVSVYMGDGPSSLRMKVVKNRILELSLTFRPGEYSFIEYKNEKWNTGHLGEFAHGFKSGIYEQGTVAQDSLIAMLFVLIGFKEEKVKKTMAPLIRDLMFSIQLNRKAS